MSLTQIVNSNPIEIPATEAVTYDSYWIKRLNFSSQGPSKQTEIVCRMVPCSFDEEGNATADMNGKVRTVRIASTIDEMPEMLLGVIDGICAIANGIIAQEDEAARLKAAERAAAEQA